MMFLSEMLRHAGAAALDLLFPETCPLCGIRLTVAEQTICDPCRASVATEDEWRCARCGATGSGPSPRKGAMCRFCPAPEDHYQGALAATRYAGRAADCVKRFKYNRRLEMGRMMADLLVARVAEPARALEDRVGWIVPVPLHWTRRSTRGFNQSQILAERLGIALGLPVIPALTRDRRTRMQTRIPHEQRAANVKDAFGFSSEYKSPPGVLLVDDVVTTGNTVNECARVLREAGAPQVWVVCFARS